MNPQTPGIKRPISESFLFPDEPRQASKTTEFDSPRSSRLFRSGEPEPFESRPSGRESTPPVDKSEEDKKFDSMVIQSIPESYSGIFGIFVGMVQALQTITKLDRRLNTLTADSCMALIAERQDLRDELEKAIEMGSFSEIRRLAYLRAPPSNSLHVEGGEAKLHDESARAALQSWETPFVGSAHQALWDHINHHKKQVNMKIYAPYCAIMQSSGLGKSRCVDELSKSQVVVPMNLNKPSARGFPASDASLYAFFSQMNKLKPEEIALSMQAFLTSLFLELEWVIRAEGVDIPNGLALWLRRSMTDKQTFFSQNKWRQEFYEKVVRRANILERNQKIVPSPNHTLLSKSPPHVQFSTNDGMTSMLKAAKKLETTCRSTESAQSSPSLDISGSAPHVEPEPLIILVFDEAHTLTQVASEDEDEGGAQSPFSHLRRTLRSIRGVNFFSLFISTTGKITQFTQFTSARAVDPSTRVQTGELSLIPPFTALGWDCLCDRLNPKSFNFSDIGFPYQVRLGRPMFGSRYLATSDMGNPHYVQNWMLQFAATKILGKEYTEGFHLVPDQALACLAQRLPIEFMSTGHTVGERRQVENHMRVCISINNTFSTMSTMNPSEPLLSEAASVIMSDPQFSFDAPAFLKMVLAGFPIHPGNRGELVGMLLLTLARDKVISKKLDQRDHPGFFTVVAFLQCLFPTGVSKTPQNDDILEATPSVYLNDAHKTKLLKEAFAGIYLHFNHFVKRGAQDGLTHPCRAGFLARNAAVMGANSQAGFDCGLPINHGVNVVQTSTALILFQFKNDDKYSATIKSHLFDMMNPVILGIIEEGETLEVPIIRIVFAMAGRVPALYHVREQSEGNFTAYDIWASGLTGDVFSIIDDHLGNWQALLGASHGWKQIYKSREIESSTCKIKQTMTPMAGDEETFWKWLV